MYMFVMSCENESCHTIIQNASTEVFLSCGAISFINMDMCKFLIMMDN